MWISFYGILSKTNGNSEQNGKIGWIILGTQ